MDEDADEGQEVKADEGQEEDIILSDDKESDIDGFIEARGCEAREDIHPWLALRDQIKANLEKAHRGTGSLIYMKELLILQNFTTL
jgi:hypothetical protein